MRNLVRMMFIPKPSSGDCGVLDCGKAAVRSSSVLVTRLSVPERAFSLDEIGELVDRVAFGSRAGIGRKI